MTEVTLVLNNENYTLDRQMLIKHSKFLKDLLEAYPDKKEFNLTFPIKSLDKFVHYVNGVSNTTTVDYDEFIVNEYLDTKNYFDHLIYLIVEQQGPEHEKIKSLGNDVSWEIYDHLPLNMVPKEMLTDEFIKRYRTKKLPEYPKNVIVTRSEEEIKTEVLISGNYCKDGLYQDWNEHGQLMSRSNWLEGELHGLYQTWYEDGNKERESNYFKGFRHGLHQTWYQDEQIMEKSNWSGVKLHGLYQSWYPNGQMMQQSNWSKGEKHGLYESWHENGQKDEVSNWIKGKRHGSYQSWYQNGQKNQVSNWIDGKRDGLYQLWYENGKKYERSNWVDGKRDGIVRFLA